MPRNSARISRMNFSSSTTRTRAGSGRDTWLTSLMTRSFTSAIEVLGKGGRQALDYHQSFGSIESDFGENSSKFVRQRTVDDLRVLLPRLDFRAVHEGAIEGVLFFEMTIRCPVAVAGVAHHGMADTRQRSADAQALLVGPAGGPADQGMAARHFDPLILRRSEESTLSRYAAHQRDALDEELGPLAAIRRGVSARTEDERPALV